MSVRTQHKCLTSNSISEVDGIVLKKRQLTYRYPFFQKGLSARLCTGISPLIIKANQEIWVQQRSEERSVHEASLHLFCQTLIFGLKPK